MFLVSTAVSVVAVMASVFAIGWAMNRKGRH